jgi:hypothetical protein
MCLQGLNGRLGFKGPYDHVHKHNYDHDYEYKYDYKHNYKHKYNYIELKALFLR